MTRCLLLWVALGIAGCGGAPSQPPQYTANTASPKPEPSAPQTSSSAAPQGAPPASHSPTTDNAARPAGTSKEPASPPAVVSPFFVIGELGEEHHIFPVGERAFLASDRRLAFQLVGDDVVFDPKLERGIYDTDPYRDYYGVAGIIGRWPDAAFIYTHHQWNRSSISKLRRWNGKQWLDLQSSRGGYGIRDIQPWSNGRLLAFEVQYMHSNSSFRIVSGNRDVEVPVLRGPKHDVIWCKTHLGHGKFKALPSGHVFVAGSYCDVREDGEEDSLGIALERWAPGQRQSTFEVLPFPADAEFQDMLVLGSSEVWVSARTLNGDRTTNEQYFLTWDGARWKQETPPVARGLAEFFRSSTGEVFIRGNDSSLWQRGPDSTFAQIALPGAPALGGSSAQLLLTSFWPRATGDHWAVAKVSNESYRYVLLHTRPATHPLPTPQAIERRDHEQRIPGPPSPECATPFVLLYTLSKKAPPNYDYPATRAALAGNPDLQSSTTFVEFERDGRRYFGAKVDDFKDGKLLAKLVKEKVPGSTPQLACHDPVATRTLGIDLNSGALLSDVRAPTQ